MEKEETGLGNEKSRKNNSQDSPFQLKSFYDSFPKSPSTPKPVLLCILWIHRWEAAVLYFAPFLGYAPANQQSLLRLCFSSSEAGEQVGPKNLVQDHVEPEQRLSLRSTVFQTPACLISKADSREGYCKSHFILCKPRRSKQILEGSWCCMQLGSIGIIGSLAHRQFPAGNAGGQTSYVYIVK